MYCSALKVSLIIICERTSTREATGKSGDLMTFRQSFYHWENCQKGYVDLSDKEEAKLVFLVLPFQRLSK